VRFLHQFRRRDHQAVRDERVLAAGRFFLATTGLAAIYLDPTEPAQFAGLMYALLIGYALYSLVVLLLSKRNAPIGPWFARTVHTIDILWTSILTALSQGAVSPFFLFFLFAVLAAAYRWGLWETVMTSSVTAGIFALQSVISATGWIPIWATSGNNDLNFIVTRIAYLLLTGFLLGYLAEQEKSNRAEIAASNAVATTISLESGLQGSIAALGPAIQRMFDAQSVDIVIHDPDSEQTLLWRFRRANKEDKTVTDAYPLECDAKTRDAWLFHTPVAAWYAERAAAPNSDVTLPTLLLASRPFANVMGVNLGVSREWQGRVLLFDVPRRTLDQRLRFLLTVAHRITPAISNVFLITRLRTRAGVEERARVSRELHDGVIQTLISAEMRTEVLRRRSERECASFVPDVAHVQELLRAEIVSLRQLMQALSPVELDSPEQLPEFLGLVIERFRRDTGISARFMCNIAGMALPLRSAIEVIRIVQEALVNVRKHSGARTVVVALSQQNGRWTLSIQDDGRGFGFAGRLSGNELNARVLGPSVIAQRVRTLHGQLAIESAPDTGARIIVTFEGPPNA
jgi:signal transduction histidine kinase